MIHIFPHTHACRRDDVMKLFDISAAAGIDNKARSLKKLLKILIFPLLEVLLLNKVKMVNFLKFDLIVSPLR